jgi:NADH/NAD ratio-sensing transcriptional regulator Rex
MSYMDEKRKMIEAELKALGINTIDELNEAIKKEKLDVTLMVAPPNKKAATC